MVENFSCIFLSDAHYSGNLISEGSDAHARTADGDQETMHEGALGEESGEQALAILQGDENGGQHDCQTSDVAISQESEALVTAAIIHGNEMISNRVVELNPTTADFRTDEAEVGAVK